MNAVLTTCGLRAVVSELPPIPRPRRVDPRHQQPARGHRRPHRHQQADRSIGWLRRRSQPRRRL